MKQLLLVVLLLAGGFVAWSMMRQLDPETTARLKCEAAIEHFTGYDVSLVDVTTAHVAGDVFTGTVTMPFTIGGTRRRVGVCVFESGSTRRITLDGQLLAGTR